jgi:hypothetical protein
MAIRRTKSIITFPIIFQLDWPDPVIISSTMPMVLPTIEAHSSGGCRRRFVRRQAQTTNLTSDQNLQFEKHQFNRMVNSDKHFKKLVTQTHKIQLIIVKLT